MIGRPKRSKDEEEFIGRAREHMRRFKVSVIVLLLIREIYPESKRCRELPNLSLHSPGRQEAID
jgi:hypothetical protein